MINNEVSFFEALIDLMAKDVIADRSKVKGLYKDWQANFDSSEKPYLTDVVSKSFVSKSQFLPEDCSTVGIDLPTWFGNFEKKRVFFLGIDPMRKASEFIKNGVADIENEVIVGTPYAFHHSSFRTKRTKAYWDIIDNLKSNHFVYVTDIFKSFFYTHDDVRSYNYYMSSSTLEARESHRKILMHEINSLIKPDLIVTFGALSYKLLMDQKYAPKLSQPINTLITEINSIPVLPLMHLSGSTRENSLVSFFKENDIVWEERDGRQLAARHYAKLIADYLQ
jgi:hypothetical protein